MYYPYSENKDADQLRGFREADLRLGFCICKNPVFSRRGSYYNGRARKYTYNARKFPYNQLIIVCLYIKDISSTICESLGTNFPKSQYLVKDCQFADPLVNYLDSVTVSEVSEIHNS